MKTKLQILGVKIEHKSDYRDSVKQVGVIAKAELRNPATRVCQVIRSWGLWEVEHGKGADHVKEVANEQLAQLKVELLALGIGERAIDWAFKKVIQPNTKT